ncbi:Hypothetical predicted protein [Octopus vulgaris]|uniref:Helitron helicase-like domain-containing protein n=1 Tax=Octopus vulgaris TaxID=6645 RepID=A0AA36BXD8_OCTVU|nr:Hypothetical predicted protein [Octopus vulgaris]
MHFISGPDDRRYNNPVNNEIEALVVDEDGAPPFHRDIIIYLRGEQGQQISYLSQHLDLMIYPILFPNRERGWQISMEHEQQRQTRVCNKVTMQQFYCYRLATMDEFSPIHKSSKLLKQEFVDAYIKVEGCLYYIREHQNELRVAIYSGLMAHLARNDYGRDSGVPVILPSSLTGSPRNMQQSYQDAMTIVCK